VFEVGFKSKPIENYPFILWLITGMIPWFYFAEAVGGATNAITDNSYLVKKVNFQVSMLPVVRILSSLNIHVFFIFFIGFAFALYGYKPSVYYVQVIYYLFCMITLALGISWITSALVVFVKDVGYLVATLLQFGFWLTPIFWSIGFLPERFHKFIMLNPVYYITEGYRYTFIYKVWFWEQPLWTLYFWSFTAVVLLGGGYVFSRLEPHFADVM